jgi:hypothetical protein
MPALPELIRPVWQSLREEGPGFLTLWARVRGSVPGWLAGPDARLLYAFAHHGPGEGAIVEIGSAWGRSTVVLARGSKQARRERVYAVDPHTGDPFYLNGPGLVLTGLARPEYQPTQDRAFSSLAGFQHTIRRFGAEDWVIPVVSTSTDAARTLETGPVRLLYVDGLHTFEGVKADIEHWVPRLISGGIVVFDDYYTYDSVRCAVDELLASGSVDPILGPGGRWTVWTVKR